MERNYTVYIHQNQINGKKYVGITSDKPESRWRNGAGYKNQVFGRAIEKYGWNAFYHIIIAENLSQAQAELLEKALIEEFHTQSPEFGYNITSGGGATLPELYKQVYQYNDKGKLIGQYNSYKEAEKVTGIQASSIGLVCEKKRHTAGNYLWSKEMLSPKEVLDQFAAIAVAKKEASQRGAANSIAKTSMKVRQIDLQTGEIIAEYSSQREAARALGIDQKGISNAIKGKYRQCGGYAWCAINKME